jgi:hypothetical protein
MTEGNLWSAKITAAREILVSRRHQEGKDHISLKDIAPQSG